MSGNASVVLDVETISRAEELRFQKSSTPDSSQSVKAICIPVFADVTAAWVIDEDGNVTDGNLKNRPARGKS